MRRGRSCWKHRSPTRPKPACPSAHSWVSRPGRFPSVSQRAFVRVSTAPCPAHDSAGLRWGGGLPCPLGQRRSRDPRPRPSSTPLDRCHCNHGVTLPFSRERCPLPGQRLGSECLSPQRTEDRSTTAFSFNDGGARPPLPEVQLNFSGRAVASHGHGVLESDAHEGREGPEGLRMTHLIPSGAEGRSPRWGFASPVLRTLRRPATLWTAQAGAARPGSVTRSSPSSRSAGRCGPRPPRSSSASVSPSVKCGGRHLLAKRKQQMAA